MAPPPSGKRQAAQHIAIYSAGSIIRQLAGFLMLPIYTSYLSPADYGVVGLLTVMVSLFELLIGARFAQAVPKFYYEFDEQKERYRVVSTALFITLGVSILSTALVAFNSGPVSQVFFGTTDFKTHVALYCMLLFTMAIEAYGLTFLRLQERPVLFVAKSIAKLVVQLSLNILLVVHYKMGVMGVIYSSLISSALFALISLCYILLYTGFQMNAGLVHRFFRFSWPLWLAGIAGLYVASSNRYFIRVFSDLDQVGLFELANRFAMILPMLIWTPFSQWWQTERFKLYQSSDRGVSVFPVVFNGIATVKVFVATGICLFSAPVIQIMAAQEFHPAFNAVPLLVYAVLLGNLKFFFFFSFLVTERTIIITYIKYGSAILATALYIVLIPWLGYVGAALSILATDLAVLVVAYILSKRYFDNGISLKYVTMLFLPSIVIVAVDYTLVEPLTGLAVGVLYKALLSLIHLTLIIMAVMKDKSLRVMALDVVKFFQRMLKQ